MELKETLIMPKTDFGMKAGLGQKEPEWQKLWKDLDVYNKRLELNKDKKMFYLHDGPPYANGNIHVGHALNKILKDIIVRHKNMNGFNAPFICGWDTHGLPIEQMVTKSGIDRKTTPALKFREECEKYARTQIEMQITQFERLGLMTDFNKKYVTLEPWYEEKQLEIFYDMLHKGFVFKGLKPVYWSWSSESALAEAEIEYADKRSPSIYVAFKITEGTHKDCELVIWTTTPWTMPANRAIAVGEKIVYAIVEANSRKFIVAKSLSDSFIEACGFEGAKVTKEVVGSDLLDNKYFHPLTNATNPVLIGHHANEEGGTGLVHIAPGHGEDDYIIGQKHDLETACVVDEKGMMNELAGEYVGMFYEDANKDIGMKLEELGNLLKLQFIKHSYPHDWRTKKPIIFRATPQWFVTIKDLKDKILNEVNNKINWTPDWGSSRMNNMMENRGDWCISRQRLWGVPIPLFYNEKGEVLMDKDQDKHILNLVKEHGTNIWYEKECDDLLIDKYKGKGFTKENDIMDVWFDSGTSYNAVGSYFGLGTDVDLYLEGSDQYRGWYNSSLITSVATMGKSVYKGILSHGFVLDGKGKKMSKSVGNVIDPLKVCNKTGADILRLWVAQSQFTADVRVSDEIIQKSGELYRKIRNTFKFGLGNIVDLKQKDLVTDIKAEANIYMMNRLNNLIAEIEVSFNEYNFNELLTKLMHFITNDLSSFYFDFTKDVLYCNDVNDEYRKEIVSVIYYIIDAMARILAPIIPHTCEEVYSMLDIDNKAESIHLLDYPKQIKLNKSWDKAADFFTLKEKAYKLIEDARNEKKVGKSLEVHLTVPTEYNFFTNELLEEYLIVSKVSFGSDFKVEQAEGKKCERCWKVHNDDTDLCTRCNKVVGK